MIIYSGTVRGLFNEVLKRAQSAEKLALPKDTNIFGRQLRVVMENILNKYGIYAEYKRNSQSRLVTITYKPAVNDKPAAKTTNKQNIGEQNSKEKKSTATRADHQSVNKPTADKQNKNDNNKVDIHDTKDIPQKAPAMSLPPETKSAIKSETQNIDRLKPNSGVPLYMPLTNLSTDMMLQMVLSNRFVPLYVKYNTIIWQNWDIFAKAKCLWKVVRQEPLVVKTWCQNLRFCTCEPNKKQKGLYEAKFYDLNKKNAHKIIKQPVSLKEAVQACEKFIDEKIFSQKCIKFMTIIGIRRCINHRKMKIRILKQKRPLI